MTTSVLAIDIHAHIYGERLRREFPAVRMVEARELSELPAELSDFDVLIAFGVSVDDDVIGRLSGLQWIQSLATGVDHFLRCPSLKPDVLITSGRGIHGPSMRETVAFLMLALSREATRHVEDQKAHVWDRRHWSLLCGKTAVVAGTGVVGTAIGELLQAFGMRVIGVTRTPRAVAGFDEIVATSRLAEIAGQADYLINVLPGSRENLDLFGRDVFAAMKKTACFINAGRGETVDEAALIAALRERRIAGAGLDVFRQEPLPSDSPLWDLPNVFLMPHIGGYFLEYEDYVLPLMIENMRLFLAGRRGEMRNVVAR